MPYLPLVPLLLWTALAAPPGASTPSSPSDRSTAGDSHATTSAPRLLAAKSRLTASEPRRLAAHTVAVLHVAPAAAPSDTVPDEATRSAAARTHYTERRYLEAARMYEQLWRDTQAAKYRFNAGMARSAAEHDGAAIIHWQAYLSTAPTVTARERSMLASEITAAKQRTRPLQLKILGPLAPATLTLTAPEGAPQGPRDPIDLLPATTIDLSLEPGNWTATITRPDRPTASITFTAEAGAVITLGGDPAPALDPPTQPPPVEPPVATPEDAALTITLGPPAALARGVAVSLAGPAPAEARELRSPEQTWQLAPGAWTVRAEARDYEPLNTPVQLGPGEQRRLDLQLRPDRDARTRFGLSLGLGITGFTMFTAGAVLTGRTPRDLDCSTRTACQIAVDNVLDRSTGLALIGTGLGTTVTAITAGLMRSDRGLLVETGVGGALLTGGLAWYMVEVTQTTALDHRGRAHAAATVLGLGGGMFAGAVISLVVRRITRQRTPPPVTLVPSFRGLSLAARF
ncbi:hypothetical protein [Nannocystis sp.]|uniref:hypothetical protein n=1 Tax=Nannocystis sp. TaxID=1962667 RepID=UPI0025E30377|nr:hypothetical protein [Nannocystis sp.]MBK7824370.1 hypothetical protein [Nannocystis sp.]